MENTVGNTKQMPRLNQNETLPMRKLNEKPVFNFTGDSNGKITRQAGKLSIKGYALREWFRPINRAKGLFFIDFGVTEQHKKYTIHYKDAVKGVLQELDFRSETEATPAQPKAFLEALIFDLGLFNGDEPIIVYSILTIGSLGELGEVREQKHIDYGQNQDIVHNLFPDDWTVDDNYCIVLANGSGLGPLDSMLEYFDLGLYEYMHCFVPYYQNVKYYGGKVLTDEGEGVTPQCIAFNIRELIKRIETKCNNNLKN